MSETWDCMRTVASNGISRNQETQLNATIPATRNQVQQSYIRSYKQRQRRRDGCKPCWDKGISSAYVTVMKQQRQVGSVPWTHLQAKEVCGWSYRWSSKRLYRDVNPSYLWGFSCESVHRPLIKWRGLMWGILIHPT